MDLLNIYKNSKCFDVLFNDILNNMQNHAYLLTSNDENLNSEFAVFMAMQLICKNNLCAQCNVCNKILKQMHSDVMVFPKNDAKCVFVDDVNYIVNDAFITPFEEDKKIYIINNLDKANTQAQNKLLKTLEEPPKNVIFIITATNMFNMLTTLKSRAKNISFILTDNEIVNYLISNYKIDNEKACLVVSSCNGNLTTAKKLVNDSNFVKLKQTVIDVFCELKNSSQMLKHSNELLGFKNLATVLNEFELVVRDIAVLKTKGKAININYNDKLKNASINYTLKSLNAIFKKIQKAKMELNANCGASAIVDNLLMSILEVKSCKQ